MKTLMLAVALLGPAVTLAQPAKRAGEEAGFHERLYQRYCEKLRESPEAYVQFVRRMQPVHGLTYSDFAPPHPGAPVRADCRVSRERVGAVNSALAKPAR